MFSQESILNVHLENDVCFRRKIWWEDREQSQEARELSEEPGIITDRIEQTFEDIWEAQFDRHRRVVDDDSPHDSQLVSDDEMRLSVSGIQDFNPGGMDSREDIDFGKMNSTEDFDFGNMNSTEDFDFGNMNSTEDIDFGNMNSIEGSKLLKDGEMQLSVSGIKEEEDSLVYERPLSKKIRACGKNYDSLMYGMHLLLNNHHLGAYEKTLNKHPTLWEKGAEGGFHGQVVKIEGSRKGGIMFENVLQARQEFEDELSYDEDSSGDSFPWSPSFTVGAVTHSIDPPSSLRSSQSQYSAYTSTQGSRSSLSQFSTWSSTQGSTWSSSTSWDTPFME